MRTTLASLGGFSLSYLAKKWIFHPLPMGRSDERILNKVRSKARRLLRHPELLQVQVNQGRVTLSGVVLSHEEDHLIAQVLSVHGVFRLKNNLRTVSDRSELTLPGTESGGTVIIYGDANAGLAPSQSHFSELINSPHPGPWLEWAKAVGLVASGALGAYVAVQLAKSGWLGQRVAELGRERLASFSAKPKAPQQQPEQVTPIRAA